MHREETEDNSFTFPFYISVKNHITVCTYYNQSYSRCDRQASFICLCTHTHTRARARMHVQYISSKHSLLYKLFKQILDLLRAFKHYSNFTLSLRETHAYICAGCHIHMRIYEANAKCHAVTKYAVNNITSQSFNISFVRNLFA